MKKDTKESVLTVKHVYKNFKLPHEQINSIKRFVTQGLKKKRKGFETQHALRDINIDIKKGEFFGIVGRNGSGKSTLLKILAGIYQPTRGEVKTTGKLVPFIELGVGFNPELTGRENVYLNGALLGFSRKEIDAQYDDIVAFAELERFMDQKLKNYSSGMQVRLAFSVATRAKADVLLVDEVLAVGDADFQRKCYDYFKALKKTKTTVVFVTHDMNAVREYCDRVILIEGGDITSSGKPNDVADDYLKLFNNSMEVEPSKDQKRWGGGEIKIADVAIKADTKKITVDYKIKALVDVDEFVLGYNFMDNNDRILMGGNTLNANGGQKLSIATGKTMDLHFEFDNVLGSGNYTFNTTVRSGDGSTVFDKWDNVTTVKIAKAESYYPIIAPADMVVK
jgi:ABC-2 type transport system ATP-binding protein